MYSFNIIEHALNVYRTETVENTLMSLYKATKLHPFSSVELNNYTHGICIRHTSL